MPGRNRQENSEPIADNAPTGPVQETEPTAKKRTKVPVAMVLTSHEQLAVEVADMADLPTGKGSSAAALTDAIQTHIEQVVAKSFETGKWLVVKGAPEAQRELEKRLRVAGAKLGYGIRMGNHRVVDGQVRVVFLATVRKQYTRKPKEK